MVSFCLLQGSHAAQQPPGSRRPLPGGPLDAVRDPLQHPLRVFGDQAAVTQEDLVEVPGFDAGEGSGRQVRIVGIEPKFW